MTSYERVSCVEALQRAISIVHTVNKDLSIIKSEHVNTLRLVFGDQEVIESINYLISQKKIDMQEITDFSFWE